MQSALDRADRRVLERPGEDVRPVVGDHGRVLTDPPADPGPEPGDGPGRAGGPLPDVVVPDDASSLQRDVEAL
ncbi:MAG: hypothetical protein JWN17_1203, partial [Frankiales bacterium]|nr:hypothetical protein [Frankiales bacterium]